MEREQEAPLKVLMRAKESFAKGEVAYRGYAPHPYRNPNRNPKPNPN